MDKPTLLGRTCDLKPFFLIRNHHRRTIKTCREILEKELISVDKFLCNKIRENKQELEKLKELMERMKG